MDSFPFSYMAATPFQIFSLCLAETPPDEVTFKSGVIMAARKSKGQEKSKQNIENPRRSCRLRPLSISSLIRARIRPSVEIPTKNCSGVASQYTLEALIFVHEEKSRA
jgi:hypothetical protein